MYLINRENFKKLMLSISKDMGINIEKYEYLDQVLEAICLLEEMNLASKMQEATKILMLQKIARKK
jgi:hypothetical protein